MIGDQSATRIITLAKVVGFPVPTLQLPDPVGPSINNRVNLCMYHRFLDDVTM